MLRGMSHLQEKGIAWNSASRESINSQRKRTK